MAHSPGAAAFGICVQKGRNRRFKPGCPHWAARRRGFVGPLDLVCRALAKGRGERAVVKNGWNHYVVYAVGDELRVEINGTVCTHLRDGVRRAGIIALQVHSGGPTDVRFRDIRMRKIPR